MFCCGYSFKLGHFFGSLIIIFNKPPCRLNSRNGKNHFFSKKNYFFKISFFFFFLLYVLAANSKISQSESCKP